MILLSSDISFYRQVSLNFCQCVPSKVTGFVIDVIKIITQSRVVGQNSSCILVGRVVLFFLTLRSIICK